MNISVKVFDPFEEWQDLKVQQVLRRVELKYLASEISDELGLMDVGDIEYAIKRTFDACCAMGVPIDVHFHKIFRNEGHVLTVDWELSDFACCLLLLNADPANPQVAKAQLYYLAHNGQNLH